MGYYKMDTFFFVRGENGRDYTRAMTYFQFYYDFNWMIILASWLCLLFTPFSEQFITFWGGLVFRAVFLALSKIVQFNKVPLSILGMCAITLKDRKLWQSDNLERSCYSEVIYCMLCFSPFLWQCLYELKEEKYILSVIRNTGWDRHWICCK